MSPKTKRKPKRLTDTLYVYVEEPNKKFALAQKKKYGSTSAYVDSLVARDRAKASTTTKRA